jgi:tetratricopeptide (TPR) repeat protein
MKVRINTTNSSDDLKSESIQVLAEPAVKNYEIGLSFGCDYHYYRIHAMHYRIHRDLKQHCLFSKQLFDLYEIHYPQQKQSNAHGYKIALYNYLNACFTAGDLNAFPALLEKAKSLPSSTKDEEGEDWQNHIHLQLIYLLNTGELEKATALREEIDKGIARYNNKVNKARELALYYNLATAYFLCGNWPIAFNYYNKVLQDNTDARKDLKYIAELLLAALQFELGNSDLTEYLRRNIERRLKGTAQYEFIKTYFKFISALAQAKTLSELEIKSLYKLFEPNIELSYWVRSKVEKTKINIVFAEQLKSAQAPK